MSNFNCHICGSPILEGDDGEYITGCSHYPLEKLPRKRNRTTITTHFKLPRIVIKETDKKDR